MNTEKKRENQSDIFKGVEEKMQKTVTAIYLVSDLIPEDDTLRESLRQSTVETLSVIGQLAVVSPSQAQKTITEIQNKLDQTLNLLRVCVSVGFVSDMNFFILSESLIQIRDTFNSHFNTLAQRSHTSSAFHNRAIHEFKLPKDLVETMDISGDAPRTQTQKDSTQNMSFAPKGNNLSDINKVKQTNTQSDKKDTSNIQANTSLRGREKQVLDFVREKGEVSLGDVALSFPEVSEKTVQRTLVKLVSQNKLNKTGEKRWSRYSVAFDAM